MFGVLVFVLGTLVVANAWGVIDAKLAASSAAREAARAFVQEANADPGGAALAAADQAITASGRSPDRMTLVVDGAPVRCSRVVATVRYRVPLISVPILGSLGAGFTASATHSELVDPYRSGLPGEAQCPAA